MEYERIHKVQTGMISPSKLRMKLMMGSNKSNPNSSRTSPSRLEDTEFVNNSLLLNVQQQASTSEDLQQTSKCDSSSSTSLSLSSVHPIRSYEDEALDYDSTSSFEFRKGGEHSRPTHRSLNRSLSRPMSSKWNDAEKWIVSRQNSKSSSILQSHGGNRASGPNTIPEGKPAVKRVDFCQPACSKFGIAASTGRAFDGIKDSTMEADYDRGIRSVSMRDMGTEMTPIPSQEPSRSPTPAGATTPLRSPTSSTPSTPCRGRDPNPTPTTDDALPIANDFSQHRTENIRQDQSEKDEVKVKTRREILALGEKLGKMNIASWAGNKDGRDDKGENGNKNYERAAAAWEEAEKAKHASRFRREEIRIEAWESQRMAKLEAEMRKMEARAEQMRAKARAEMVKKTALSREKSDEKRAAAEAEKERRDEKTAAEAEYVRRTGRIPRSSPLSCCCCW